jgi:hypothetical protein
MGATPLSTADQNCSYEEEKKAVPMPEAESEPAIDGFKEVTDAGSWRKYSRV